MLNVSEFQNYVDFVSEGIPKESDPYRSFTTKDILNEGDQSVDSDGTIIVCSDSMNTTRGALTLTPR